MARKFLITLAKKQYPLVVTYRANAVNVNIKVRDKTITASAPKGYPLVRIEELIRANEAKVLTTLARQQASRPDYQPGAKVTIVGREYVIAVESGVKTPFPDRGTLVVRPGDINAAVYAFARKELGFYLKAKIIHDNLRVGKLTIRKYKSKWGSCNVATRDLAFNVELAFLDVRVIDYVYCHEIAHIKHPNHSREFWHEVAGLMPDYQIYRDKLKEVRI